MPETELAEASGRKSPLPPYVPYRTFLNFLDSLKNVVMPSHIDKAVIGSLSGGMQSWLKASLKSMKLVDVEARPQERLRKLVASEGEDRKVLLRELFNATYAPLLKGKVDLQSTTTPNLKSAFAELGAQGETIDKQVAFLMALAKDAGLELSAHLKRSTPQRRRPRVQRGAASNGVQSNVDDQDAHDDGGREPAAMKKIALTNAGGSLTLSGTFNPFALMGEERDLVYLIIDKMSEYETKTKGEPK